MYSNPEGTGEVLLFPFYDAENGNATNMHIVNTTEKVKAVKVRFLEYKASYEVLDFNLYLSQRTTLHSVSSWIPMVPVALFVTRTTAVQSLHWVSQRRLCRHDRNEGGRSTDPYAAFR